MPCHDRQGHGITRSNVRIIASTFKSPGSQATGMNARWGQILNLAAEGGLYKVGVGGKEGRPGKVKVRLWNHHIHELSFHWAPKCVWRGPAIPLPKIREEGTVVQSSPTASRCRSQPLPRASVSPAALRQGARAKTAGDLDGPARFPRNSDPQSRRPSRAAEGFLRSLWSGHRFLGSPSQDQGQRATG